MKYITTLFLMSFVFWQCTKTDLSRPLDENYAGKMTFDREAIRIKHFNTQPDSIRDTTHFVFDDIRLTIRGDNYFTPLHAGTISRVGDSIRFNLLHNYCPLNADCVGYLMEKLKYEDIQGDMKLTHFGGWEEYIYNDTLKYVSKVNVVYEFKKVVE
jgi:hypothetical protein